MSGLCSSESGSGKLGCDSVGMIIRRFFVTEIFLKDSENLCHRHLQNGSKNIVKSNIKIKIAFTNCCTGIIILPFLAAGTSRSAGINSRFFRELTSLHDCCQYCSNVRA